MGDVALRLGDALPPAHRAKRQAAGEPRVSERQIVIVLIRQDSLAKTFPKLSPKCSLQLDSLKSKHH